MIAKLTSREVARARAAAAGATPLPLDHPIRFEGPSITFLSHTRKQSPQKDNDFPANDSNTENEDQD